jgi:hypothetical protein
MLYLMVCGCIEQDLFVSYKFYDETITQVDTHCGINFVSSSGMQLLYLQLTERVRIQMACNPSDQ